MSHLMFLVPDCFELCGLSTCYFLCDTLDVRYSELNKYGCVHCLIKRSGINPPFSKKKKKTSMQIIR